ncbi:DUF4236 domain-containing protein [Synechocystis sp. PCC 7339]|uniref:DUF4236 domain-containing protein n=1 Tax=unclassified Synechocystis TaxID=2640012 RepID=UPI001BB051A2|nr:MULTISPECIES: DUF4236 domain-containing protein [unclassified Synechocystis]QUS60785.1 DUF4236 domain-containing protein [Synechocystis sp. PCC 7338]UAJ72974.1 DUF4236 domain-containing protein [Synechocystis sp. PCC 7339]
MGLRFRKSIKIAPGIRVNLSKSGASLSIGGKGSTVNISSRGVRTTYSIPGTGISYVTQTSSGRKTSNISSNNRSAYQELIKQQKEQEKQRLSQQAQDSYELFKEQIELMANILKNREKDPFDWESISASRGEYVQHTYVPPDFIEPQKKFSKDTISQEIRNKNSRSYITYFLISLGLILLFKNYLISVVVLILGLASYFFERNRLNNLSDQHLQSRLLEEEESFNRSRQKIYESYIGKIDLEQKAHENDEQTKKKVWDQEEKYRQRLRSAVAINNPEPLTELLEIELSNEDLPVPLVFDIEFISIDSVSIFMEIPELDVVPEENMFLTKTGKLSTRKMAQKDRLKLYSDVCTGLTLRLVYETLRVIYCVNTVEVYGSTEQVNPANGHNETIISLYIKITRESFDKLDLDSLDPTSAFMSLNGVFACNKKGVLLPLRNI